MALTAKNVQAFRTAFNVAHALFERLGSDGWRTLLDTVAALDDALASPATTTATPHKGLVQTLGERDADLAVLEAAAAQLLEASADGSTATAMIMMESLMDISACKGIIMQASTPCPTIIMVTFW
jgi:hypothetical protein